MLNFIKEIKNRIILIVILGFSSFLVLYIYKETILFLIVKIPQKSFFHVNNFNFLSTNITEIFLVFLNSIKFISLQIIVPYFMLHFFLFFTPALYKTEYNTFKKFFFNIIKAWFISLILNNYFMVPLSWNFFFSFQTMHNYNFLDFYFEAKISDFLNFYETIYYICLFYVESFMLLITFLNFIHNKIFFVKKCRKIYYYIFFIFSVLISPPDVFSQFMLFLFVLILFELFVLIQIFK